MNTEDERFRRKMEMLFDTAKNRGYIEAVYKKGCGNKLFFLEMRLIQDWLLDKHLIHVWVQPLAGLMYTPYYRDLSSSRSKNQKFVTCETSKNALIEALTEAMKIVTGR